MTDSLFDLPDSPTPPLAAARIELAKCQAARDKLAEYTYGEAVSASAEEFALRRAARIVANLEAQEMRRTA